MEKSLQYTVALQYSFKVHKSSVDEQNNRSYTNCHLFFSLEKLSKTVHGSKNHCGLPLGNTQYN